MHGFGGSLTLSAEKLSLPWTLPLLSSARDSTMKVPWLDSLSPRRRKLVLWGVGLVLFYTIAGFFIAPPIVRAVAAKQISKPIYNRQAVRTFVRASLVGHPAGCKPAIQQIENLRYTGAGKSSRRTGLRMDYSAKSPSPP